MVFEFTRGRGGAALRHHFAPGQPLLSQPTLIQMRCRGLDAAAGIFSICSQNCTHREPRHKQFAKFAVHVGMSAYAKAAEEQGEVVRKIKEAIKADPAAHTKDELDAAVAKLKELKAKADDPMNALEDPVTKVSRHYTAACCTLSLSERTGCPCGQPCRCRCRCRRLRVCSWTFCAL